MWSDNGMLGPPEHVRWQQAPRIAASTVAIVAFILAVDVFLLDSELSHVGRPRATNPPAASQDGQDQD
ncbi:hypothetical protein IFR05_009671 [Cadophora sp. M221]|nr:hypothetical protein IFR05_009671 [Cadophora sp. M221]